MIPKRIRQSVRTIYAFTCGYCGISETELGAELTIDHYMPRSAGGSDAIDNLVYACHACNEFKGQEWDAHLTLVLHPLRESFTDHFIESPDGVLIPQSDAGQRHIETLHLNRPPLVRHRRNLQTSQNTAEAQRETQKRLAALEKSVQSLTDQISQRKRHR